MTDDIKLEEAIKWSDDKIVEEEAKIEAIEPVKYTPQKLNFVVNGKETAPSKEQEERINAIMKPLNNIHFSWSIDEMKKIVEDGIKGREELLTKLDAKHGILNDGNACFKQSNEEINKIKTELNALINDALKLAQEISNNHQSYDKYEKQKMLIEVKDTISNLQNKLQNAVNNDLDMMRQLIQAELAEKHEDEDFLNEQVPKMLEAKQKYEDSHKPVMSTQERINNLQNFFDEFKK